MRVTPHDPEGEPGGLEVRTNVIVTSDLTPPPVMIGAQFLPNGAGATVTFDRATDRAGLGPTAFDCTLLFTVTRRRDGPAARALGPALGVGPSCTWLSPRVVRFIFGADATIYPNLFSLTTQ